MEVLVFNGICEIFIFRGVSYVNFFNVSKQFNVNVLIYSEFFVFSQVEFLQIMVSFYVSFSEVVSFRFGYMVSFFSIGGYLNSMVVIVSQVFNLSNVVCFNFDYGYWDRNVVFCEDMGYIYFFID